MAESAATLLQQQSARQRQTLGDHGTTFVVDFVASFDVIIRSSRCSMLGFYIAKLSRRHEMPYAASFCPLYSLKEHGRSSRQQLLTEEQVRKRLSCIVTYSVVVGSLRECLVSPPSSSSSLRGNSSVVVSEEIYGTGCCCCCLLAAASIELPQRRDRLVGLS